jgi:endosialidase-like protein
MRTFSVYSKSSGRPVSLPVFLPLLFLPVLLTGQTTAQQIPLKNWAAPLYWQPNQAERETAGSTGLGIRPMVTAISTSALTFVAITPCRLVDTRGVPAGFDGATPFSGPSLASGSTTTFPVQSTTEAMTTAPTPCGTIPSIAQAYSFNITVVPKTAGGVAFITVWPTGSAQPAVSTLNDGTNLILANAAIVPAGTPSGGVNVINSGPATTDLIIDMNGYYAEPTNLQVAGNINFTGSLEYEGIPVLQLSGNNTAFGVSALVGDTSGIYNTATGFDALLNNSSGTGNTAMGYQSMELNNGGSTNTAFGFAALQLNTSGNANVALGYQAAGNVNGGNSNNIHIGSQGTANDSAVIRIGNFGTQTAFFAAGANANLGSDTNAVGAVVDTTTGQLGVISSSRRYKEDIEDMGEASRGLMDLRPVTYRYKQPTADGSKPIQYGLIAEEVAEVYPDLVAHTADGAIETVKYQVLDSMLLNEVQRQQAEIRGLEQQNRSLQERLEKLESALSSLSGASGPSRGSSVPAVAAPVVP